MTADARKIKAEMESLGTYREEYLPTIARLASLRKEHDRLNKKWTKLLNERPLMLEDFHKPLILSRLEILTRDILTYERDLGLTPAALRRIDAAEASAASSASPTERLLESLDDDDP